MGFDDPLWWSIIKCTSINIKITMGSIKCSEKNRLRVG